MRLLLTGGTGFIGAPLCQALAQHDHELLVLTREPKARSPQQHIRYLSWHADEWQRAITDVDGVINLAGAPLAAKRWSSQQKRLILDSRVQTTSTLVSAMAAQPKRPSVVVSVSAIGYYGPRGDELLTELAPLGRGFLAEVCQAWEHEAQRAEALGVRVVRLRMGLVLGPGGGALAKMVPPFRAFIGGPLGHGRQWISWVHRDDVIGLIEWALTHPNVSGALNATAPNPVTMQGLCRELGRALHRPSWAPVPAVVLRLLLGEMADLLLTGQRVLPQVAQQQGYRFHFPELGPALQACLR